METQDMMPLALRSSSPNTDDKVVEQAIMCSARKPSKIVPTLRLRRYTHADDDESTSSSSSCSSDDSWSTWRRKRSFRKRSRPLPASITRYGGVSPGMTILVVRNEEKRQDSSTIMSCRDHDDDDWSLSSLSDSEDDEFAIDTVLQRAGSTYMSSPEPTNATTESGDSDTTSPWNLLELNRGILFHLYRNCKII